MKDAWKVVTLIAFLLLLALTAGGCQKASPQVVEKQVTVEVTRQVEKVVNKEVPKEVTRVVGVAKQETPSPSNEIPFATLWTSSGHANTTDEPFVHWNQDNPPVVPKACAKCHSTGGYRDFLGVDGTAAGVVDKDQPVGSVITCIACHNEATAVMTSVTFASGAVLTGLGPEARCMQCHQGRASTVQVDDAIKKAGLTDVDTVSKDLGFTNVHYFAAAATQMGTWAKGGYQYPGKRYDAKFGHVAGLNTCIGCHDQHSLQVRVDTCKTCHTKVASKDDLKNVREITSQADYNGNGNTTEGIYYEIQGLRDVLYQAMRAYASKVAGKQIAYDGATNPYFFIDTDGNGKAEGDELKATNKYDAWTARLAKAAYNYQVSVKDPGAFAHNGKYIIQLLYDSIEDLSQKVPEAVKLDALQRDDTGHFAGSEEAFRHWDADGKVPGTCSKCHSAQGLPQFLAEGAVISQPPANGFLCTTCHDSLAKHTRYVVKSVQFPSGAVIDAGNANTNLCINCHQGRESTVSIGKAVAGLDADAVSDKLRFINPHYFAAGASLFGTQAKGAYEYDGQKYLGRNMHVEGYNNCTQCHDPHTLEVRVEKCATCHTDVKTADDLRTAIRKSAEDFNGNGNTKEGMGQEVDGLTTALYAAIQAYAKEVNGVGIVYDANTYPYFLIDKNGNGTADPEEVAATNAYNKWTPRLLKAAYNFQYVNKDPGAFAHNGKYIIQVLYDSLADLGSKVRVDMKGMVRPSAP
jgi:hypothetical protein